MVEIVVTVKRSSDAWGVSYDDIEINESDLRKMAEVKAACLYAEDDTTHYTAREIQVNLTS